MLPNASGASRTRLRAAKLGPFVDADAMKDWTSGQPFTSAQRYYRSELPGTVDRFIRFRYLIYLPIVFYRNGLD